MNKDLLLHTCCAPCAEFPLVQLREEFGIEPVSYYFNPNIHPLYENQRRLDTLREFSAKKSLELIVREDCDEERWRSFKSPKKEDHCRYCYGTRFAESARYAAEHGFKAFTSTLFVSPYQNVELMKKIGEDCAARYGIEFLFIDFRPGYRTGQEMAKADGLYRQRFCGCIYSLGESFFKKKILRQVGLEEEDIPGREV